jgi:hypothetical protein
MDKLNIPYRTAFKAASDAKTAAIYLRISAIHLANLQFIAFPVQSESADFTFSSTGHSGLSIGDHQ